MAVWKPESRGGAATARGRSMGTVPRRPKLCGLCKSSIIRLLPRVGTSQNSFGNSGLAVFWTTRNRSHGSASGNTIWTGADRVVDGLTTSHRATGMLSSITAIFQTKKVLLSEPLVARNHWVTQNHSKPLSTTGQSLLTRQGAGGQSLVVWEGSLGGGLSLSQCQGCSELVLLIGSWVGVRRLFHFFIFLTASRMVLPQDPSTGNTRKTCRRVGPS